MNSSHTTIAACRVWSGLIVLMVCTQRTIQQRLLNNPHTRFLSLQKVHLPHIQNTGLYCTGEIIGIIISCAFHLMKSGLAFIGMFVFR